MAKRILSFTLLALTVCGSQWSNAQTAGASGASAGQVNPVIEWNRTLLAIVRTPGAQPATIHSTRSFAMLHAAIFDAVDAINRPYKPYAVRVAHVSPATSAEAAADQAAHDVLLALYPSFATMLDAELQADLDGIKDGPRKNRGIALGEKVAREIVALRMDDGAAVTFPPYVPNPRPGSYQLTLPNFAPADFVQWSHVAPFAIDSPSDFLPAPPPELTSDSYTRDFKEVKRLGRLTGSVRTPDQTEIGKFWNGNIQDFWNEIAQSAALQRHLSLVESARLFALVDISVADTVISFFEAKYVYNFWRPVSAIRLAATDGNPQAIRDDGWIPLSTKTAPDPSYPGAHSAVSSAASQVLKSLLGDHVEIALTSESLANTTRHFHSFSQASQEAGLSRLYAGQHFRFDHVAGQQLGRQVATWVVKSTLQPR